MYKFFTTVILIFAISFSVNAQEGEFVYADTSLLEEEIEEDISTEEIYTDTNFYFRAVSISPDTINKLRSDKKFQYINTLKAKLKKKKESEFKEENRSASFLEKVFSGSTFKLIVWILAGLFIIFILFKLFSTQGIFSRSSKRNDFKNSEDTIPEEVIPDYVLLVQQSCLLGDYRAAVKYLFLHTLLKLGERDLIDIAVDKTNYQYHQEIPSALQKDFSKLIRNYEYCWYGEIMLSKEQFEKIESEFISFERQMNTF